MKRNIIFLLVAALLVSGCNEYNKVLKSNDYELKYEFAKKSFEQKKYGRAYTLLEELVTLFKGTARGEESLYLLARSYYLSGDYETAGQYFTTYYSRYPKGEYAELSRYYAGEGLYKSSPEPMLDQTTTYNAIEQLQLFLEYYPKSEKVKEVQQMIIDLQEKLAKKELISARLYYDLGNYGRGNNYESAAIVAQNALQDYPFSSINEDLTFIILKSRHAEALQSIDEKRVERMRNVVDEYFAYLNDFPEGKHIKDAKRIYNDAKRYIKD